MQLFYVYLVFLVAVCTLFVVDRIQVEDETSVPDFRTIVYEETDTGLGRQLVGMLSAWQQGRRLGRPFAVKLKPGSPFKVSPEYLLQPDVDFELHSGTKCNIHELNLFMDTVLQIDEQIRQDVMTILDDPKVTGLAHVTKFGKYPEGTYIMGPNPDIVGKFDGHPRYENWFGPAAIYHSGKERGGDFEAEHRMWVEFLLWLECQGPKWVDSSSMFPVGRKVDLTKQSAESLETGSSAEWSPSSHVLNTEHESSGTDQSQPSTPRSHFGALSGLVASYA